MSEETAFALNPDEALAFGVAFAEIAASKDGREAEFDFDELSWR